MAQDRMSPKERLNGFLTGGHLDRFLCVPLVLNHAARMSGVKIGAHNRDGRIMGECHVEAYRHYGQDLITIFSDTAVLAEALGTELRYPDDDVPRVERPAVTDPDDRSRLRPAAADSGRLGVCLQAIGTAVAAVGDEVAVSCCFAAPFTTAACLRGTDQIARDLYRNKDLTHELLRMSLDLGKRFADAVIDVGGVPVVVDPVATGSVLGEAHFREFALPYLQELHAHIAQRGLPVVLHICGQTSRILDAILEARAALLSLDDIPMAEARDRVGDRVALMGNVRPAQTLLQGTPEDVLREVRALCAIGRQCRGGFVLGSGCEVPIDSPVANVEAMLEGVRQYGSFD
ncbi:MAG TPA: uroporphyrinogen decarboxylase family protein [Armatimonadota bacterium]|nr:uroporphyrinogen decarboxylase family protein [Armatimonadota bacterium]